MNAREAGREAPESHRRFGMVGKATQPAGKRRNTSKPARKAGEVGQARKLESQQEMLGKVRKQAEKF